MISAPSEMRCRSMLSDVHDREHDRQRQRDRQRHHRAGAHAEADEAADEDDHDRLPQRGHEVADRDVDGDRLVGDQHRLDADRQVGRDVGHLLAHVLAQRQDVAGVAHRDRQADGRLAVDAEHRLRRVGEAAAHGGDVAQAEDAVAGDEVDRLDVALGVEGAGDAQEHALVLGLDRCRPGARGSAPAASPAIVVQSRRRPGELLGRELDEDLLVLRAEHLDLGDVGHLQQARARRLDVVAQLAEGEAVGGEAVDDAEGVAEVVVEERADDACGSVRRMSPMFLRTWYQTSGMSSGGVDCFRSTKIVVCPAVV